jgi:hypothetical protein
VRELTCGVLRPDAILERPRRTEILEEARRPSMIRVASYPAAMAPSHPSPNALPRRRLEEQGQAAMGRAGRSVEIVTRERSKRAGRLEEYSI